MSKIIISCDTTACISKKDAQKLGIYVLPLNVIVDGKEYHDGVTIDNETLAEKMKNKSTISTSTPTPVEIENFFDKIFEDQNPDYVIHFTISSKLSSMYSLFTNICSEKYGNKVVVFDSLSVCSFMGNHVKYAVKLNNEGKDVEEIVSLTKQRIGTENVIFVPESMVYLKRGGRISPAVATIGGLLGIKPVLRFGPNGIEKETITRTIKKAYLTALDNFAKADDLDQREIHIIEFDSMKLCKEIKKACEERFPNLYVKITPMSINVCAHVGPGTVGVALVLKV